jgi:hypothetical protein
MAQVVLGRKAASGRRASINIKTNHREFVATSPLRLRYDIFSDFRGEK